MKFSNQQTRYESEFTLFLKELKEKDPTLDQKQREGRALLWDTAPMDLDAFKRDEESKKQARAKL